MFLGGYKRIMNQWASSQNILDTNKMLSQAAYYDSMQGLTTENTLAYQQMQNNLEQVDLHREDQLRMYNQAMSPTQANAQRLGGNSGRNLNGVGAAISQYSNIDSDSAFVANAIFGNVAYNKGMNNGFSGENDPLKIQRAMDSAVQAKFMRQTIKSGNEALENVNKQSGVMAANLTDTAINNQDNYYAVQSAIDDNGIEGSLNMDRNLDYLKQRDNDANQLQYDMIRGQADNVNRGMAQSFDQLVQQQEQATLSTLINPVQFDLNGAMNASNQMFMNQPTPQDWDMAQASAFPTLNYSRPRADKKDVE
jgi:hypothetical protein